MHGILVDAAGDPVADALILARPEGAPSRYSESVHETGIVHTDSQGLFRIEMLAPGSTVLYVTPPQRRSFRDGPFEVRSGADVERLVTMAAGGTLEGHALAPDGSPLVGKSIRLDAEFIPELSVPHFQARTITDSEGRFRFEGLADGTYQVTQLGEVEGQQVQEMVDWAKVEDGAGAILLQPQGSGSLHGRVELDGAPPAVPVQVTAHWLSAPGEASADPERRTPQFGALSSDGLFEITHLVPGEYRLSAFQQGSGWLAHGNTQATVLEGQGVEVVLTLRRIRR